MQKILTSDNVTQLETVSLLDCEDNRIGYTFRLFAPDLFTSPSETMLTTYTLNLEKLGDLLMVRVRGLHDTFIIHTNSIMRLTETELKQFISMYS